MAKGFFEQCEREQLHLCGTIQAHGTLLMLDGDGRISHVAANLGAFLPDASLEWIGAPPPERLAAIAAAAEPAPGSRKLWVAALEGRGGLLDVVASRGEGGVLALELTPHLAPAPQAGPALEPGAASRLDDADAAAARQALTARIAELSGGERTLYYSFRDDGDGEVVAEARSGDAYGSYLGLRFPASDIPQIARALYVKNPWRQIVDAAAEPVAVLGREPAPPDQTWSDLRAVAPVHRVYLANMGVRASLSFPVVVNGVLAALVTAHHREPRRLPPELLERAAAAVRGHALALVAGQAARRMRLIDGLCRRFEPIRTILQRLADPAAAWPEVGPWLMREFAADGAVFRTDRLSLASGTAFEPAALVAVDTWFCERQSDFVWTGDSLTRQLPGYPLSEIAGVLALRASLGDGGTMRLYLTRTEHIHDVAWGGNPDKPVEFHDGVLGIAPRRSFEKWIEKRLGYSRPWDNEARLLALKLRELLQREIRA